MTGIVPWEECEGERKMPEQGLWAAVIMRAFYDAIGKSNVPTEKLARIQSLQWLTKENKDFATVCEYAGLDAAYVRQKLGKLLQKTH